MTTNRTLSARSLQYYVINRKWLSDLEFIAFESGFFHRLIEDNFIRLSAPAYIPYLRAIGEKLFELEKERSKTAQLIDEQNSQLELMAEDVIPEDSEQLAGQQVNIEYMMARLIGDERAVKRELYDLIDNAMKERREVTVD